MWRKILLGLIFVVALGPMMTARAASTPPSGFVAWLLATEPGGSPTAMEFAPDGRLFVLDQGGTVWVIKNGELLPTPFIHISVNNNGERGLLGIAFDPSFNSNHFVYLYYTTPSSSIHNRVSRFTASGDVAVPGSEVVILNLPNLSSAENHNGGPLHFGQDGKLYIGVGENANRDNSQNIDTMLGKILRINSNGTFPTDNPFYTTATAQRSAVWALGVRNPYTFAVDPSNGTTYINDVGDQTYEEVNLGVAGANYGWPDTEGYFNPADYNPADFTGTLTSPLFSYPHTGACAITGGTFYRPSVSQFPPSYVGKYFFSDYCGDWIGLLDPADPQNATQDFVTGTDGGTVDLNVGPDGSLYYLDHYTGEIFVVQYIQGQPPFFTHQPENLMVTVGDPASFTCETSDSTATYQWQRDDGGGFTDIGGATSTTYTLDPTALSDSGAVFHCIAKNTDLLSRTSHDATLTVVTNLPPTATIVTPSASLLFRGGTKISFSGKATDPEDGMLPPSAFTWKVDLYHYDNTPDDAHVHPAMAATTGSRKGSFTIPNMGETSPNIWYRFTLTVTDSNSNQFTTYRDVFPRLVTMTFDANPPLMDFTFDSQAQTTPFSITGVAGMLRSVTAPPHRGDGGTVWQFNTWRPGGKMTHPLKTPLNNTTYTAYYVERQMLNGSFEALVKHSSRPAKWKLAHLTGLDGSDCTTLTPPDLLCSLHLVGGTSTKTVSQNIGLTGQLGDSYTLSFSTHGVGASASGFTVKLIMQNKDHTTTVQSFDLPAGDSDWTDQTLTVLATTAYTRVQVVITANPGATGDAWFDHFVLSMP